MKKLFELPDGWEPELKKEYRSEAGVAFETWVRYHGITAEHHGAPMHMWVFAIVVEGKIVEAGPFYWDPSDRPLTNENAANHLITYWMTADLQAKLREVESLEYLVEEHLEPHIWAVALVNEMFYPTEDADFDVVFFADIGKSWKVVLSVKGNSEKLYEVAHDAQVDRTHITGYDLTEEYKIGD